MAINPYQNYLSDASENIGKILSHQTASLTASSETSKKNIKDALGAQVHHFTTDSAGLFTDPVYGGFKRDLTPLIFGDPSQTRIELTPPYSQLADHPFSSRYPIIPGQRKAAQGPSFARFQRLGQDENLSLLSHRSAHYTSHRYPADSYR